MEDPGRNICTNILNFCVAMTTVSENIQLKKKIEKFSEKMSRKTKFSETEVEKLVHVYNKITV